MAAEDHPRIRGEHVVYTYLHRGAGRIIPAYAGSTFWVACGYPNACWIIPAYAGSTIFRWLGAERHRDHPRIRGEHKLTATVEQLRGGSSPHTRGAPEAAQPDPI